MSATPEPQRIPLSRRDATIAGYALVDADDYEWLTRWTWRLSSMGYAVRGGGRGGKPTILLHRVILGLEYGDPRQGDHRNRHPLDCRRENLRIAERGHKDNQQNLTSHAGSSSRYRGVSWDTQHQKWEAYATVNGKRHYLGLYANENEAAAVASAFRARHMPFSEDAAAALRPRESFRRVEGVDPDAMRAGEPHEVES